MFDDDVRLGLLAAGLGILGGRGNQAIGQGGLLGLNAYMNAKADRKSQERQGLQDELLRAQIDEYKRKVTEQEKRQRGLSQAFQGAFTPEQQGMPQMGPPTAAGEFQPAVQARPASLDFGKFAQLAGPHDLSVALEAAKAAQPKQDNPFGKVEPKDYTPESIREYIQTRDPSVLRRYEPPKEVKPERTYNLPNPSDYTPKSFQQYVKTGDFSVLVPIKAQGAGGGGESAPKPHWDASSGQFVYPPTAENPQGRAVAPTGYTPKVDPAKAAREASLPDMIKEARELLPKSTSGYVGAGVDKVLGAAGVSLSGAQVGARLKVLQAGMMMAMPRMEGPQSVYDVELYKEGVGAIGDTTRPIAERIAALRSLENLITKYGKAKPIGSGAVLRFDAQGNQIP